MLYSKVYEIKAKKERGDFLVYWDFFFSWRGMTKFFAGGGGEGEATSPIPSSRENPATLAQNFINFMSYFVYRKFMINSILIDVEYV